MKEIFTEINIKASPEKVWSVFIDFKNYPEWNPFILSIQGQISPGNQIKVTLKAPGLLENMANQYFLLPCHQKI